MKCVVLFGGEGRRVNKQDVSNKCLIPVNNKPICFYVVENLLKSFKPEDLILVTNGFLLEDLNSILRKHFNYDFNIIPQYFSEGVSHAIFLCEKALNKESFFVCLGDFYSKEIHGLIDNQDYPFLTLNKVSNPEKYGVYDFIKNIVVEKPKTHISDYAVRGFYRFDHSFFSKFKNTKKSSRNEFEIVDIINQYKNILTKEINDVIDLGSNEGIHQLESLIANILPPAKCFFGQSSRS